MWPWVSRVLSSLRCRCSLSGGGLCGWTTTIVAGRAVALCWCVAGWCASFWALWWLDLVGFSVSVPCLVLWCVVVRRAALFRVLTCCVVLVCAVLRCALLGRAVFWPCHAVVCRFVPRRVASWCGVLCYGVPCRVALHCGALQCGVPCCLVLCRGGSLEVSLARVVVRSAGRTVAGWWLGGAVR